jgi:PAS domain S-box-containing protein
MSSLSLSQPLLRRAEEVSEKQPSQALMLELLEGIISSAMDAIVSVDAEQRVVLFNPAAEEMFGVKREEAIGASLERFIPTHFREAHARDVEHFGETGVSNRRMGSLGSVMGLRSNGEEFPLEASISQVEVAGEKLFTVILRDSTERVQTEGELRQARAALESHAANLERAVAERTAQLRASVGELQAFCYSLSHDLRAPLRAIQTFTKITLDEYGAGLGQDGKELMTRVAVAAERMDHLIQDVLIFSQVSRQDIPTTTISLEKLIQDIMFERPEFQPPNAEIRFETPLLPVLANQASLTQCLTNLLSNAVKFVAPGVKPRVRIWTELRPGEAGHEPDVPTSSAEGNRADRVRLWVEDNGIGIETEAQHKIFELFQRLHSEYPGSGIGLAIVRKAVERMGGNLGVESELGKGSKFWIELARESVSQASSNA